MFEEIKEQNGVKRILREHIENSRVKHCYIFCGEDGTGRLPTALSFGRALVCENKNGCKKCTPCIQFDKKSVSDFIFADIPEGKKEIPVDAVRSIISEVYIKPYVFDRKIIIINNADKMNLNAQNAILKVLEEPPSYAVFILIVSNMLSVLPTIVSRGSVVNFTSLSNNAIREILKEKYNSEIPDSLLNLCSGSVKKAYEISGDEGYMDIRKSILTSFYAFLTQPTEKNMLNLYSYMTKYENNKEFVINVMYTVVSDFLSCDNKSLLKNKDFSFDAQNALTAKKGYGVFNVMAQMQSRLNTNVSFSLCVFSSLDEIRRILKERTK